MSAETIVIREAIAADVPAVAALWMELADFHAELDLHFTRQTDGHLAFVKSLTGHMNDENSIVYVAADGEKPVGFCQAQIAVPSPAIRREPFGFIRDFAVTARYRRRGIGTEMAVALRRWFAGRGIHRLELNVFLANAASIAFWRQMGFEPFSQTLYLEVTH